MKLKLALAAASAVAAFAAPAFAETNGSVGYSHFSVSSTDLNAITGHIGWNNSESQPAVVLGVEGEASIGIGDDTSGTGASRQSSKLSSEFGAFGVASAVVSDTFSVFARVGYANIDIKNTLGTGSTATHASYNEGGLAYGAGLNWLLTDTTGVRADYTRYDVNIGAYPAAGPAPAFKGHDATAWSVSMVHIFK